MNKDSIKTEFVVKEKRLEFYYLIKKNIFRLPI